MLPIALPSRLTRSVIKRKLIGPVVILMLDGCDGVVGVLSLL